MQERKPQYFKTILSHFRADDKEVIRVYKHKNKRVIETGITPKEFESIVAGFDFDLDESSKEEFDKVYKSALNVLINRL